jgi:phospholipase C
LIPTNNSRAWRVESSAAGLVHKANGVARPQREYSVMGRLRILLLTTGVLGLSVLLLGLSGCGGSSNQLPPPPPPASYTLAATALTPNSFDILGSATSTVTVTPVNSYTGTVSLTCSVAAISTSGSIPTCSFNNATLAVSSTLSEASTLTVTAPTGTPGGNYTVTVSASDANKLAPSNGSQKLSFSVAMPSYTLTASALTPASVDLGGTATSTITITPALGYTGTVALSCSGVTGGTPAPTCSFSPPSVTINGASAGPSTLTVHTTGSPADSYTITVTGSDANNLAPSNGAQMLSLTVTPTPSYTLGATALSPSQVTAGGTSTSTITVTPANGYTGTVTLSCSSITGGNPAPTCSFNPRSVPISGATAGTSTLSMFTTGSTPGGSYTIKLTGTDADSDAPSNGPQTLTETVAAAVLNVVIIFQENRTPDNLFYGLCIAPYGSPSACGAPASATQFEIQTSNWANNQVTGGVTQPLAIDLGTTGELGNYDNYDLGHTHTAFLDLCDLNTSTNQCAMDGADLIATSCTTGAMNCPPPANPEFYYVYPADVAPYFAMAQTYTFADHMFQTNEGPSFPAHQFIFGGTSEPSTGSVDFVSENVLPDNDNAGCLAASTTTNKLIDPTGTETTLDNTTGQLCNDHQTLADSLDNAGISWRYYAPSAGSIWTAPTGIQHICVPSPAAPNATECSGPDYTVAPEKVVLNQTQSAAQILSDISGNTLQQVSWVIPSGNDSDHAKGNTGCGPSWVTEIVNAIGSSSTYWQNTVIIITWDDWGGWYDHVPPPKVVDDGSSWGSGYVYGFRVPMIVISPYAKKAYISKTPHDFGSILKFIENNYNLPSLGVADANALDDLSDIFQFTSSPSTFTQFAGPWNDATCKSDPSPASDPDDD